MDVKAHVLACPHHPCSRRNSGCAWLGVASAVKGHEYESCEFSPVECTFLGCDAVIPRLELEAHTRACKVGLQLATAAAARERSEAEARKLAARMEAEVLAQAEQDQASREIMSLGYITVAVGFHFFR